MQPGLTLVVGPPGTGKTDVAVQIISNLYHNFPEQVDPHLKRHVCMYFNIVFVFGWVGVCAHLSHYVCIKHFTLYAARAYYIDGPSCSIM